MKRLSAWLLVLSLLALGCSTTGRKQSPAGPDPTPDPAQEIASEQGHGTLDVDEGMVDRLDAAVDSTEALYGFGDIADFVSARDSLRRSVDALAISYPAIRSNPDFKQLVRNLDNLDAMFQSRFESHKHLSETDSLALAVLSWPDDDTLRTEISVSEDGDTLFPALRNDRIDFWMRYFTGPGKERFGRTLYRMQLHRPTVERILEELELPPELICVAIIESGFYLKARSRARAVGPWQFIAGTARIYGLRVNWWYDERRDIVASTYAAGNYLKDLYGIWGSWPLALASYNCGEYRVARAVAMQKTTDFWKLRLPKQTERYVPKFLAAVYILRDPERYGFTLPDVEPIKFDEVRIKDATDLKLIAKSADTTLEVLRDLNPAFIQWATPPKMTVLVKVPEGMGETTTEAIAAVPPEQRVTWRKHRIRQGETLSTIARKYDTSVSALKRLNGIKNAHRIRAGKYLIVPVPASQTEVASREPNYENTRRNLTREALEKYAARYAAPANHKRVVHRVKSGDTLGEIAELYHTRASRLRAWNNLSYRSYIYPGQNLVIYVPDSFDQANVSSAGAKPNTNDYAVRTYTVKKGDTMYSISRKFNVRMSDLLAWNDKSSRSTIYPGQRIDVWQKK